MHLRLMKGDLQARAQGHNLGLLATSVFRGEAHHLAQLDLCITMQTTCLPWQTAICLQEKVGKEPQASHHRTLTAWPASPMLFCTCTLY